MAQKPKAVEVKADITLLSLLKLVTDDEAMITVKGEKILLKIDFENLSDSATIGTWNDISDEADGRAKDAEQADEMVDEEDLDDGREDEEEEDEEFEDEEP